MSELRAYQAVPERQYYIDIGTKAVLGVFLRFEKDEAIFAVLDEDNELMEVALDLKEPIQAAGLENNS